MEKLKDWMAQNGVNGRTFAQNAGLTDSIMSRILNGQTTTPGIDTVLKIRDATGGHVQPDDWRASPNPAGIIASARNPA